MSNITQIQAGLYARVSSEQQAKDQTIDSQVAALRQRMDADGLICEAALGFLDDGYSGSTLVRPALERLRDLAAAGGLDRLYVHSPDRLSRKHAYQVLLIDELERCGVEVVFLDRPRDSSPEGALFLQVQGIVAEYERAMILERSRRGRLHAARRGSLNVLTAAPYGYRYVDKHEGGGEAQYQVVLEQARVVRRIFEWVGRERRSLSEVAHLLTREGIPTARGLSRWDRSSVWHILNNPAYKGTAAYGRTQAGPRRSRLRPRWGQAAPPRRVSSTYPRSREEWIYLPVPALVEGELFDAVAEQLAENRQRQRERRPGTKFLLQGLTVCGRCGHAYCGNGSQQHHRRGPQREREYHYVYRRYRCLGREPYRSGGQRLCENPPVPADPLEEAVWAEVCSLLSEPQRLEEEYERRLQGEGRNQRTAMEHALELAAARMKRGLARLIDAYGAGLLEREEFEPRVRQLKARLAKLEEETQQIRETQEQERHYRAAMTCFREFAEQVKGRLDQADWPTRREIIRALVKRVEIDHQDVRVVYRVTPSPSAAAEHADVLPHCSKLERA